MKFKHLLILAIVTAFVAVSAVVVAEQLEQRASVLILDEITTPTAETDKGKIYTKTDNELYFQDGAGSETLISSLVEVDPIVGAINGMVKANGAGTIAVAVADTDYQQAVSWGDGLEYATGTAKIDHNSTNLRITSTEIDTIQGISSAASPTFTGATFSGLNTANGLVQTDGSGVLSTSLTPSGLTSLTANTFLGALDTNNASAGVTVSGTTIQTDGTDSNINLNLTPKGTGDVAIGAFDLTLTGSISDTTNRVTKIWLTDGEFTNPPTIAGSAIALDNMNDVTLSSPAVDNVLKYNGGNWTNASSPSASGTVGTTFYSDDTNVIATGANNDIEVNSLLKFPSGAVEDVHTISVANNTVIGETYLYNTALGGLTIDAGEWLFNTYASVNSVTGGRVSSIIRNIYHAVVDASTITTTGTGTSRTATAAGGTPFAAGDANAVITDSGYLQTPQGLYQITGYTSATVVTVETPGTYTNEAGAAFSTWKKKFGVTTGTITALTTNYEAHLVRTVQSEISIAATDKLAEIVFGVGNNTTDIYFVHNGSEHYSNFRSPFVTRHNDLPGLNGGSAGEYYHQTAAQHTISTQAANTTLSGYLLTADWDTFNDKAEADLSNLSSVAVNTSILPGTEDSISWGSATKEFLNGYIGDAGKLYFGLAQDGSIHHNAANELTITASAGVTASADFDAVGALTGNTVGSDGNITLAGTLVGFTTALTGTVNNALVMSIPDQGANTNAGVGLTINADDGGTGTTGGKGGDIRITAGDAKGTGDNNGGILRLDGGVETGAGTAGYVSIGTGSPNITVDEDSLYVNGVLEAKGKILAGAGVNLAQGETIFSSSLYGSLMPSNDAQTPTAFSLLTGASNNSLIVMEFSDKAFDFAHADPTNPTLFIHSTNQSATEWISFTHDQTDGLIDVGTGNIKMNDPVEVNGGITLAGTLTGITTAITGTQDNTLTISVPTATTVGADIIIEASDAGGIHQAGILTLRGGAGTPDGFVRITDGTDLPTQTLNDESLFVKGKLEVDGQTYFDNELLIATDKALKFVSDTESRLVHDTHQGVDSLILGVGVLSNSFLIVEAADTDFNFGHIQATHPTLFIHSTNQATDEYISFFHSGTDSVINSGKGAIRFLDPTAHSPSSTTTYLAAEAITVSRGIMRVAGNGGSVTITATPSIVDATADGVCADIVGTHAVNTLILQDADTLPGSGLALAGNVSATLGLGDVIHLCFDSGDDLWKERYRVENIDD